MIKRLMFLVAAAVPVAAQAVPTFSGNFAGTVTGGRVAMYFPNGAPPNATTNIIGMTIDLDVVARIQRPLDFDEMNGSFEAYVNEVQPQAARLFYGDAKPFQNGSGYFALTAHDFTFELRGAVLRNNSRGNLKLVADRQGSDLVNWRGIASGHVQLAGITAEVPYDHDYYDVTFILDDVNFLLNGSQTVPEPATWGLMICGFGLAGAGMRRARVKQQRVAAL